MNGDVFLLIQTFLCCLVQMTVSAWETLKEKFRSEERCSRASCSDVNQGTSSKVVYPPDRAQIGRANWRYVHMRAAGYPEQPSDVDQRRELEWIQSFIYTYPCGICARDFTSICTRIPPKLDSRLNYEAWWVAVHNEVNRDLSKPLFYRIS